MRIIRNITKYCGYLIAILIILIAILLTILRFSAPLLEPWQDDIEFILTEQLQHPIRIGHIKLSMYRFRPVLQLEDIHIYHSSVIHPILQVDRLTVGLNIISSLYNRTIEPSFLIASGATIHAEQLPDGRVKIGGFTTPAQRNWDNIKRVVHWLLRQEKFVLQEVTINWRDATNTALRVSGVSFAVTKQDDAHVVRLMGELTQTVATKIALYAKINNALANWEDWSGDVYVAIEEGVLPQWVAILPTPDIHAHVTSGEFDAQVWFNFANLALQKWQALIDATYVGVRLPGKSDPYFINHLAGNLFGKPIATGWEVTADQMIWHSPHFNAEQISAVWRQEYSGKEVVQINQPHSSYLWLPKEYTHAIPITQASAKLAWYRTPDEQQWLLEELYVANDHLRIQASGVLANTLDDMDVLLSPASPLDLDVHFQLRALDNIYRYLPYKRFQDRTTAWWQQSDISGDFGQGVVNIQGSQVNVTADVYNVGLNYDPDWPRLTNAYARMIIDNCQLTADVRYANLFNIPVENASVIVSGFSREASTHLTVNGEITTDSMQTLEFVANSPLAEKLDFLAPMHITGPLTLDLLLDADLEQFDITMDSQLQLHDNVINLPQWGLPFTQVNAQMTLSMLGVEQGEVNAKLFEDPLQATIVRTEEGGASQTTVDFAGKVSAQTLQEMHPIANVLVGETNYQGEWQLADAGDSSHYIVVKTDWIGMQQDLPEPFNRTDEQAMPSQLTVHVDPIDMTDLTIQVDDILAVHLLLAKNQEAVVIDRGVITLGAVNAQLPFSTGIEVTGQLPKIRPADWLPFLSWLENTEGTLRHIDVQFDALDLWGQEFTDFHFIGNRQAQEWQIDLASNQFSGQVVFEEQAQPLIKARMDYLELVSQADNAEDEPPKVAILPSDIPMLDVQVERFVYADKSLGALRLETRPEEDKLIIEVFDLEGDSYRLQTIGEWYEREGLTQTRLRGYVNTRQFHRALASRDFTQPPIDARYAELRFDLTWDEVPWELEWAALTGEASFQLQRGEIYDLGGETEDMIGLGKALSIFSLQTIPRRLSLDFSDLSGRGFSFDRFAGDLVVERGHLTTNNTVLEGPVAHIAVRGSVDSIEQSSDLTVQITPYLTSSLPLVAAIAGGPIIGAATWAADQIVHHGLRNIAAYTFTISGPWATPNIVEIDE